MEQRWNLSEVRAEVGREHDSVTDGTIIKHTEH